MVFFSLAVSFPVVAEGTDLSVRQYCNPLEICIADPSVLFHNGTYYLAGTGVARYVSRDMVNWERLGNYIELKGSGLRPGIWAAEIHEKDGRFFYYFSAKAGVDDKRSICVAMTDSPATTFTKLAYPMLRDEKRGLIDPHVFADEDGTRYLYCTGDISQTGNAQVCVAPLGADMKSLAAPLKECIKPSQPWERKWQEGVWVTRWGDTYYMLWSSRVYASPEYSVGFATSPSPMGPWTKYRGNPILKKTKLVSGPGHVSLASSPDGKETFILYHTHRTSAAGGARQLAIDRIHFEKDPGYPDRIVVEGPTRAPQPYPSGAAPTPIILGRDDFLGPGLDRRRWIAIWNENPPKWLLADGRLAIRTTPGQVHEKQSDGQNIFLQYALRGDWRVTTRVHFACKENFEQAFLVAWQDSNNYVTLKKVFAKGQKIEAAAEIEEKYKASFAPNPFGDDVFLRLEKREGRYRGFLSGNGKTWTPVGDPMEANLVDEKAGIGACCPQSTSGLETRFDFFDLERLP